MKCIKGWEVLWLALKPYWCSLSCVKIQKNTNLLTLGQIKFIWGLWTRIRRKKFQILIIEYAKLDFYKKKIASAKKKSIFLITLLCISKEASRWVDFRTENQIKTFKYWPSYRQKTSIFWTTSLIFLKTLHI